MLQRAPKQTLEVGFAFGTSAAVIAACHRELGATPQAQHVAIDPFQRETWDDAGRMILEQAGLAGYVSVMEEFSDAALPRLVADGFQCDLAYVDGSHLFEDVFVDFYYINLMLRINGIILFDDNTDPHVHKVMRFIARNRPDAYQELDLTAHRAAAAQTLKYEIARRLGRQQLVGFQKFGESRRSWDSSFFRF
jgi:predicted O-methyltransferase YrrM